MRTNGYFPKVYVTNQFLKLSPLHQPELSYDKTNSQLAGNEGKTSLAIFISNPLMNFSESKDTSRSFWHLFFFVWILFLLLQQGQRFFLFSEALTIEVPLMETLISASITGFRADIIISTLAAGVAAGLTWVYLSLRYGWTNARITFQGPNRFTDVFRTASWLIGSTLMLILMVDMGYYHYAHTHLDFVFFEYIEDLLFPHEHLTEVKMNTPLVNQAL